MNAVRMAELRLFTVLRVKIHWLVGFFLLFNLMVERIELDVANPDVNLVAAKTNAVRYLNYDIHLVAQSSRLVAQVKANLEVTANQTRIVYFLLSDAYRIRITDLKINTYPADFVGQGGLYRIELPFWYKKGARIELELAYVIENPPRSNLVLAELNADWYPKNMIPDKVTAQIQLDVPADYKGIANGELVDIQRLNGRMKRYRWLQMQPISALGITVGKYQMIARTFQGRDFRLFFPPGLNRGFQEEILEYAAELGDFYYAKFGGRKLSYLTVVFNDMEWKGNCCGSLIFLHFQPDYLPEERKSLLFDLAHELSHYWWGNQLIPKQLHDWWLVEGFANYSALVASENLKGPGKFEVLKRWRDQYRQTTINLQYYKAAEMSLAEIGPFDLQRELLYSKGAFVLQMIDYQIGTAKFDRYIAEFVRRFCYKPVGIDDFTRLGAELYGAELVDFFRQWIYSTGTYNLALGDLELIRIGNRYRITVTVKNTGHLYLPDRVELEIITKRRVYTEDLRLSDFSVKMQKVLPDKPIRIRINSQPRALETELADNVLEIR